MLLRAMRLGLQGLRGSCRRVALLPLLVLLLHGLATSCPATTPAEEAAARKVLTEAGLTHVQSHWLVPEEIALKKDLARLGRLERDVRRGQHAVEVRIRRNKAFESELQRRYANRERLDRAIDATSVGSQNRNLLSQEKERLEERIREVKSLYKKPEEFSEDEESRRLVIEENNARNRLALLLERIEAQIAAVKAIYHRLGSSDEITDALHTLGEDDRLGDETSLVRATRRVARSQSVLRSDSVPLYRQNEKYRFTGIINGQTVVTFTYRSETGHEDWVPASVARRAGLQPLEGGKVRLLQVDGRVVRTHPAKVARLAIGSKVLENIEVRVLPPEAEDLGAQLTSITLARHVRVEVDPGHLRLRLRGFADD